MKIEYLENRFNHKEWIPHLEIYHTQYEVYYAAFIGTNKAYLTVKNITPQKHVFRNFEPSIQQKHIVIQQIFFKLKGLIEN